MATDEGVFLEWRHEYSRRIAMLEVDSASAWLYLYYPDERRPEKDVFAYSVGLLVTTERAREVAKAGTQPPLASEYASPSAVLSDAKPEEFSLRWSTDGESVALIIEGRPLAMIVSGGKRGYSAALGKSGPFGEPWYEELYRATFAS